MSRYDEKFFKLHWYKNNDRCNQHCQSNGEDYETHIWEKTGQHFTDAISRSLNLTPKLTSKEKRKQNKEKLQNSHEKLKTTLSQDDFDVNYFLSPGKSYSQYKRDRLAAGFTSKEESAAAQKKNQIVKNKKHHGPFQSYYINQEALENESENMSSNRPINWTRLAKKKML